MSDPIERGSGCLDSKHHPAACSSRKSRQLKVRSGEAPGTKGTFLKRKRPSLSEVPYPRPLETVASFFLTMALAFVRSPLLKCGPVGFIWVGKADCASAKQSYARSGESNRASVPHQEKGGSC